MIDLHQHPFNSDPESNKHLIAIHEEKKKGKPRPLTDISNETFIKWVSLALTKITSETISNSWRPLTIDNLDMAHIEQDNNSEQEDSEEIHLQDLLNEIQGALKKKMKMRAKMKMMTNI